MLNRDAILTPLSFFIQAGVKHFSDEFADSFLILFFTMVTAGPPSVESKKYNGHHRILGADHSTVQYMLFFECAAGDKKRICPAAHIFKEED